MEKSKPHYLFFVLPDTVLENTDVPDSFTAEIRKLYEVLFAKPVLVKLVPLPV